MIVRKVAICSYAILLIGLNRDVTADQIGPFGFQRCIQIEITRKQNRQIKRRLRRAREQGSDSARTASVIPVYFNIIQDSSLSNPASEDQISAQMDVLNQAYSGSGYSFALAGIQTVVDESWAIDLLAGSAEASEMKSTLRVGDAQSLNIYLTGLGGSLLGYATFPWDYAFNPGDDGIVMLSTTLPGGSAFRYDLGNTAVHEVGHWLGLFHTFQPGFGEANGCGTQGDFVSDTPSERIPHYNCRRSDSCRRLPGRDPIRNF
ncbi:MAG: hypothetical protein DCC75_06695, partial [Proteobacteria bacterium]